MLPGKIVYEGKAKVIIDTNDPLRVIQHFKDDITAFNKQKCEIISNKGMINNYFSAFIMEKLENEGVRTHFIKVLNEREQLVSKLKIIPLEVVIRNIAAGSFCKRFNIKEGEKLESPIIEFFYKNDSLSDPMVSEDHILYFEWLSHKQIQKIKSIAQKVNKLLLNLFLNAEIDLVDFKLEFGFNENTEIILADEVSPDNCRLWDKNTFQKLDKDVFRLGLGDVMETYLEVSRRLKIPALSSFE